jgi:osmoprotectant transport system substrate-binding protein
MPARPRLRHRATPALACVLVLVLGSGCGLGTAGGFTETGTLAGPVAEVESLDGLTITVGSKNFTEQIILGKTAVILLKSAGAAVHDLTNIPGSASQRQAMLEGDIGFEWEYTGTAWIAYLGHSDPIPDPRKQYEAVRKEDLAKNDLVWLDPAPMNNTYGFAAKRDVAEELGVSTLSDLAKVPPAERTFCVESEFENRNDGFQPMLETYGIPLGKGVARDNVKTLDTGAIYAATDQGVCSFGEVFTTDGRIKALDLVVLEDDRKFFPVYNVSAVFLEEIVAEHPQIEELFNPLSATLTDEVLIELNARVDVEGEDPAEVAWDYLTTAGFLDE